MSAFGCSIGAALSANLLKLILEDRKLRSGDMVRARIGAKIYTAKILDADDPAKLLVDLDNGRKAVVDLVNDD